jgi:hypothetical protein
MPITMPDYTQLRAICQNDSRISKTVIDENLLYYASARDRVDQDFDRKISRFSHAVKEMPSNWIGLIKAQFIGHQIFKAGGLIGKYLNHSAIKALKSEEGNYLKKMGDHTWRFSFGEIAANPAPDFYEMADVFSGDTYILHSPSMSQTLREHSVLLWFNLIGNNGSCWQTFGPVIAHKSFSPDDIYFYATEINPAIDSETDLIADIERNPVQYMMLAAGSNYPLIKTRGHELVQVHGEGQSGDIDVQALKNEFTVEYAESVFRLKHAVWSEPPYSSEAYYNEESHAVCLTGLSDEGYHEMSLVLKKYGLEVPPDPDIRIHLTILILIEKLFKKRPVLDPYSRLFATKKSPKSEGMLKKLNQFIALALPYINSGKDPDVDALAKTAGVDPETARDFLKIALEKIKEMRK